MALRTTRGRGLTFIEVLFVIVIISVMVAVSIPRFGKTFQGLRFHNFSRELQIFMHYLQQRSIVEGKIIFLSIDDGRKEYFAQIQDAQDRLKTYAIPNDIRIESSQKEIFFYPDGTIDKVTIELVSLTNQRIILTTKGVFGGVKLQSQE